MRHVADGMDANGLSIMDQPVPCPSHAGVWRLPAMAVVQALLPLGHEITMLGPPECFVHIVPPGKRNRTHIFRTVFAFLLLMIGSALAITWFHADVNMLDAQKGLYRLMTGREIDNMLLITLPYAVGVFLGVALFYALLGKKKTVSPLEIKLEEYRNTAEKAAGQTP